LGASPNYKDCKGLTPLYMCVMHASDVVLCEMLLHDHSIVGAQDLQGWQEVHQVRPAVLRNILEKSLVKRNIKIVTNGLSIDEHWEGMVKMISFIQKYLDL